MELSDCTCPICMYIIIEPVTMPCGHELCLPCFKQNVQEASLTCPLCRTRISTWARKAARNNKLVNQNRWKQIQEAFPSKVQCRLEGREDEYTSDEEEEDILPTGYLQISEPGAIRKEYEAELERLERERREAEAREEEASRLLIQQLEEQERREAAERERTQQGDEKMARSLSQQAVEEEKVDIKSPEMRKFLEDKKRNQKSAIPPALAKFVKKTQRNADGTLPADAYPYPCISPTDKPTTDKPKSRPCSQISDYLNRSSTSRVSTQDYLYIDSRNNSTIAEDRDSPHTSCVTSEPRPESDASVVVLGETFSTPKSSTAPVSQLQKWLHSAGQKDSSKKPSVVATSTVTAAASPGSSPGLSMLPRHRVSCDSLGPELRHFRPIQTCPRTPPKRLPNGSLYEPPMIKSLPCVLVPSEPGDMVSPPPLRRSLFFPQLPHESAFKPSEDEKRTMQKPPTPALPILPLDVDISTDSTDRHSSTLSLPMHEFVDSSHSNVPGNSNLSNPSLSVDHLTLGVDIEQSNLTSVVASCLTTTDRGSARMTDSASHTAEETNFSQLQLKSHSDGAGAEESSLYPPAGLFTADVTTTLSSMPTGGEDGVHRSMTSELVHHPSNASDDAAVTSFSSAHRHGNYGTVDDDSVNHNDPMMPVTSLEPDLTRSSAALPSGPEEDETPLSQAKVYKMKHCAGGGGQNMRRHKRTQDDSATSPHPTPPLMLSPKLSVQHWLMKQCDPAQDSQEVIEHGGDTNEDVQWSTHQHVDDTSQDVTRGWASPPRAPSLPPDSPTTGALTSSLNLPPLLGDVAIAAQMDSSNAGLTDDIGATGDHMDSDMESISSRVSKRQRQRRQRVCSGCTAGEHKALGRQRTMSEVDSDHDSVFSKTSAVSTSRQRNQTRRTKPCSESSKKRLRLSRKTANDTSDQESVVSFVSTISTRSQKRKRREELKSVAEEETEKDVNENSLVDCRGKKRSHLDSVLENEDKENSVDSVECKQPCVTDPASRGSEGIAQRPRGRTKRASANLDFSTGSPRKKLKLMTTFKFDVEFSPSANGKSVVKGQKKSKGGAKKQVSGGIQTKLHFVPVNNSEDDFESPRKKPRRNIVKISKSNSVSSGCDVSDTENQDEGVLRQGDGCHAKSTIAGLHNERLSRSDFLSDAAFRAYIEEQDRLLALQLQEDFNFEAKFHLNCVRRKGTGDAYTLRRGRSKVVGEQASTGSNRGKTRRK